LSSGPSITRRGFLGLTQNLALAAAVHSSRLSNGITRWLTQSQEKRPALTLGLYLPFSKLPDVERLATFKDTLCTCGANCIVVDIKNEWGLTHVPFEHALKPKGTFDLENPDVLADLITWCERNGIYLIGRLVVMSDGKLLCSHPGLGLRHVKGGVWCDSQGVPWADPMKEEIASYNAAIASAAAVMGIPEIQYDYVRFPSDDSPTQYIRYQAGITFEKRTAAIARILAVGRQAVHEKGSILAADVFNYTAWEYFGDMGIGQHLETLSPYVDVLSPMAYPSLYGTRLPSTDPCPDACFPGSAHPYEVVKYTVEHAKARVSTVNPCARIVPWIQAYPDARYGNRMMLEEFEAQQRGALQAGAHGVLAWNPSLNYDPDMYRWIQERTTYQANLMEQLRAGHFEP
jgi:hypothetical protein